MTTEVTATAPVTLVDLMDQLILPPVPEPISLMPQTTGWVVLGIAVVGATAALSVLLIRRYRANAYRRAALAALSASGADPVAIARIVRQTALMAFPRIDVASLHGEEWLKFLDRTAPQKGFLSGSGRFVATAPYQDEEKLPKGGLDLARAWIKSHSAGTAS